MRAKRFLKAICFLGAAILFEKGLSITMTLLILAGNRHWSKRRVQSPGRMWTLQISNLYLGSSRRARPLPSRLSRPCRSSRFAPF